MAEKLGFGFIGAGGTAHFHARAVTESRGGRLVGVVVVAVLLVGPALALLYRLDATDRLTADHDEDLTEPPATHS